MSGAGKTVLIAGAAIWCLVVGTYLINPFGTATWDPRARIFGHVPYRIPATSMAPTLNVNDIVVASTYVYASSPIQRRDVVVFIAPSDGETHFVKRVAGVPGDKLSLRNRVLFLNGNPQLESYLNPIRSDAPPPRDFPEVVVPPNELFMLGDNRDNSYDSRYWGFVHIDSVVGRVDYILYSEETGRIGRVKNGDE